MKKHRLPCRNQHRKRSWVSVLLVLLTAVFFSPVTTAGNPFKGLLDPHGRPASLNETYNNGRWTLVMVWSTDCVPCTRQKPLVSNFYNKHKVDTANVVGIAVDGRSQVKAVKDYLEQHKPSFPNYVANRKELLLALRRFGVTDNFPTPLYILFDRNGEATNVSNAAFSSAAVESVMAKRDS